MPYAKMYIFGEKITEWEYSKKEMLHSFVFDR